MLGRHRLCAIIEIRRLAMKLQEGCVCMVRWPAVLQNLSWFFIFDYMKKMEHTDDRKFTEVYVCQKPGLKVCLYAPVLRTGTSEKSLRQYRHFCQKNSLQQCRIS